jgi:aldose 1-epimerase
MEINQNIRPPAASRAACERVGVGLQNEHWDLSVLPEFGACCAHLKTWHQGNWHDVFRPMSSSQTDPFESGAFAMLPYVNRLGVSHPVHGVGWMQAWHVAFTSEQAIRLQLNHQGDIHWPYDFSATQTWSLQDSSLCWDISVTHQGAGSMPAGIGFHPFFSTDADSALTFNANAFLWPDAKQPPQIWTEVDAGDDRQPLHQGLVSAMEINHCFEGWSGGALIVHPSRGFAVKLQASADLPFVSLYRSKAAPWLCIEPATHANGAFSIQDQSLDGLGTSYLQARGSLKARLEISIQNMPERRI